MRRSRTSKRRRSGVDDVVWWRRNLGRGVDAMVGHGFTQADTDQSVFSAAIFPGQGSQKPGMGKELADQFAIAREVFEEADDALGLDRKSTRLNSSHVSESRMPS